MFRRLPMSLPPDVYRPKNLEEMGYIINANGQVGMIGNAEQGYHFKIDRNDRVNEVHLAVVHECIRADVYKRLSNLGLQVLRLPIGAGEHERHVPIYTSSGLHDKKRVVVVFGSRNVDAGIFSYRLIADKGVNEGSAVALANTLLDGEATTDDESMPGLIIANPCQLIWYRRGGRAVGDKEWLTLPRDSAVYEPFAIHLIDNRIPENNTYAEHVQYVFQKVLNRSMMQDTTFDIIGMEYTGLSVMHFLAHNWNSWAHRINGICLGDPQHTKTELKTLSDDNKSFGEFVKKRVRGYLVSEADLGTLISGSEDKGFNCYASGEQYYEDGILAKSWKSMLDWFDVIATTPDYEEPIFTTSERNEDKAACLGITDEADLKIEQGW